MEEEKLRARRIKSKNPPACINCEGGLEIVQATRYRRDTTRIFLLLICIKCNITYNDEMDKYKHIIVENNDPRYYAQIGGKHVILMSPREVREFELT